VLKASVALGAAAVFAQPLKAAPPPSAVTPTLIEAAKKEGKATFYLAPPNGPATGETPDE